MSNLFWKLDKIIEIKNRNTCISKTMQSDLDTMQPNISPNQQYQSGFYKFSELSFFVCFFEKTGVSHLFAL